MGNEVSCALMRKHINHPEDNNRLDPIPTSTFPKNMIKLKQNGAADQGDMPISYMNCRCKTSAFSHQNIILKSESHDICDYSHCCFLPLKRTSPGRILDASYHVAGCDHVHCCVNVFPQKACLQKETSLPRVIKLHEEQSHAES